MLSRSDKKLEKYSLPSTVDGICSVMRQILDQGLVARIELDVDDSYIRAWRFAEKNDFDEPNVTLDGALRNIPTLVEYASENATSYQVLVDMMLLAQERGMHAIFWTTGVGGKALMVEWLELEARGMPVAAISHPMGLPIHELKSLPKDTLLLCCSQFPSPEPSEITLAIKAAIELRSSNEQVNKDADRGGSHSKERAPTTRPVWVGPGQLRRVPWKTGSEVG